MKLEIFENFLSCYQNFWNERRNLLSQTKILVNATGAIDNFDNIQMQKEHTVRIGLLPLAIQIVSYELFSSS